MEDRQLESKVSKAEEELRTTVRGKRKHVGSHGDVDTSAAIAAVNGGGEDSNISSTIIQVRSLLLSAIPSRALGRQQPCHAFRAPQCTKHTPYPAPPRPSVLLVRLRCD